MNLLAVLKKHKVWFVAKRSALWTYHRQYVHYQLVIDVLPTIRELSSHNMIAFCGNGLENKRESAALQATDAACYPILSKQLWCPDRCSTSE